MKKTKLLVLPLMALLLSSCATAIKGSDMPELVKDPGHLLKLTITGATSGDHEVISSMNNPFANLQLSVEFYSNFVKLTSMDKEGEKTVSVTKYVMRKDDKVYTLSDENGKKSKIELSDSTGFVFETTSNGILLTMSMYILPALTLYTQMTMVNGESDSDNTLKRSGDVYTLSHSGKEGAYTAEAVGKLTIKNDYVSAYEMSSSMSKDDKKATYKLSAKYTFGKELSSYSESKMPNPANFA